VAKPLGLEPNVYSVTGWVSQVGGSKDGGDGHIELTQTRLGALDPCIVVEMPPGEDDSTFEKARGDSERLLGSQVKSSGYTDLLEPMRMKFIGLAFFDEEHRRKAPNRLRGNRHGPCDLTVWETHPVKAVLRP